MMEILVSSLTTDEEIKLLKVGVAVLWSAFAISIGGLAYNIHNTNKQLLINNSTKN